MINTNSKSTYLRVMKLLLLTLSLLINPAFAIDNPDAPDYIGELKIREQFFLNKINNPNNGTRDYLIAYDDYQIFLDKELNKAYQLIKSKLPAEQQKSLLNSQRNWIKFRDTEFELIKNTWTRQSFGSSSGISRGSYRSTIIRNRVLQLLDYAKSY